MAISSVADSNTRASQAEVEASRKIADAQKRADDQIKKINQESDRMKDVYMKNMEDQQSNQDSALQRQNYEGYQHLKTAHDQKQKEIRRTKENADHEIAKITEQSQNDIEETERLNHKKVQETDTKLRMDLTTTEEQGQNKVQMAKESASKNFEQLEKHKNEQIDKLAQDSSANYEKTKNDYQKARVESEDHFTQSFQDAYQAHENEFRALNTKAVQNIKELKRDTAEKLGAYSSRNEDPFYRMVSTNAEFTEGKDAFVLTALVPPHEQKSVTVAIQGNTVVLSGYRKNQEQLDSGEGHKSSTASFQSFSETFPLNAPVDPKGVLREYTDGQLIVRIPKRSTYLPAQAPKAQTKVATSRLERPQFPDNLPTIQPSSKPKLPLGNA